MNYPGYDSDGFEKIYNDTKRWYYFSGEESETIGVYARCNCVRYLKAGQLLMNRAGEVKLKGWVCSRCGEVEPYFDRDINQE